MLCCLIEKWRSREAGGVVLLLALLALFIGLRWAMMSGEAAPPGSDGGNWLAFSKELFGDQVKAADAAYPPLFPLLVRFTQLFFSPLVALKVLGLAAAALLGIPAYLLLRTTLGPLLSAVIAAAVPFIDYNNEVLAWGGYPQLLGAAFLLFSLYFLLIGLYKDKAVFFVLSAVAAGLTVATHTLASLQLLMSLVALLAIYVYVRWGSPSRLPTRRLMSLMLLWGLSFVALSLAVIPFYLNTFYLMAGNPANPHHFDILNFLRNFTSWRNESYMWLIVSLVGGIFSIWMVVKRQRIPLAEAVVAIMISALLGFAFLREIRSAHLLEIGLLLSAGVLAAPISREMASRIGRLNRRSVRYSTAVFIVIFLVGVLTFGQLRSQLAFSWFRVVDNQVLAALDWVRANRNSGDIAVASETPHEGILGWWVEGYAELPTYLAVDPRWLSFSEEKTQAEVAHHFLALESKASDLRELAKSHDVRFLLLHKDSLDGQLSILLDAGFVPSFENNAIVVLKYRELQFAAD